MKTSSLLIGTTLVSCGTAFLAGVPTSKHGRFVESSAIVGRCGEGPSLLARKATKNDNNEHLSAIFTDVKRAAITSLLALSVLVLSPPQIDSPSFVNVLHPPSASAASYKALSDEQKAVAEAWRVVDNTFLDRTFNRQDWFKMREDSVHKKYKDMDEARSEIQTMIGTLGDKYTRYLPPDKYQSMVNTATGSLAGVGVQIGSNKANQAIIVDVEPNSPAFTAGMRPNDIFVEGDGVSFDGATPEFVASVLRGPEGTTAGVTVERNGKTLDFRATRAKIKVTSVNSYLSEKSGVGKVGVIRIKIFSSNTSPSVADALVDFKKQGVTAFVLDLRRNPGGLLPGGVDTASLFLDENKPVVFVVDKKGIIDSTKTLTQGFDLESPLVLFVDSQTASASEVMVAALKENNRATVVGQQTFGKGIIQTIRELSNDNGGVAVTIARYETPLHNDINKQGIPVDIAITDCESDDAVKCIPLAAFNKKEAI